MNTIMLWIISALLALVPAAIWLYIFFKYKKSDKKMLALIFSGGILAVLTVFAIQYLWANIPEIDPFLWIENNISDPTYYFVGIFVLVGIMEELVKQMMVRYVDSKTVLIQTINDSIRFSLVAALGFAFAENIIYFKTVMMVAPIQEVIVTFLFRSIFTVCAHMIFSGIFGYFFGIAKFTIDITRNRHWEGKVYLGVHLIKNIFRIPYAQAFKEYKILQGLLIAISLHAIFDYMLQMNQILPVIVLVGLGYAYLRYLLSRKAGNLILVTDISEKKKSTMGKRDKDVVLELVGMWFDQKKYRRKKEIEQKRLSKEKKEKLFRFVEEKRKEDEKTFKIDI